MEVKPKSLASLYIIQALAKGFSVFYFVLLPVLYAEELITTSQLGYIGALFILMLISGAVVVARSLHGLTTKKLLQLASLVSVFASSLLLLGSTLSNLLIVTVSYAVMGLAVGTAMSGVNALAATLTTKGDRYKSLARLGMLTDVVRIVFPLFVAGAVVIGASYAAILVIIFASLVFFAYSSKLPDIQTKAESHTASPNQALRHNKPFRFVLSLEFLDSFSSSQLFVFLPLLFLVKGYSIENSLVLQSFIFMGYLSGRWFVGYLATRYSGVRAIAFAEIGMAISIIVLLFAGELWMLYILSFILGVFARGTSPAIKALAFDNLEDSQIKQGSALHVVAGDSGSALAQLLFGLLIAWYGINTPFIVAVAVALVICVLCTTQSKHLTVHRKV